MSLEACLHLSTTIAAANRSPSRPASLARRHLPATTATHAGNWKPLMLAARSPRRSRFLCQANNAVNEVLVVNDKNWESLVVSGETPVLVEFWADWCGPCRMIAPVIDELAKEYAGKIVCCKCNTDDCPAIASKYGIRSIPTVLVFKAGEKKDTVVGAVPKATLTTIIDKYLADL